MSKMDLSCLELATKAIERASDEGVFLVTGGEKPNVMTIGWGTAGVFWRKPVFMAVVRHSRYSHNLLEEHSEFVVSVPLRGQMLQELSICGSESGRDVNKIDKCGFILKPAKMVKTPIVSGCDIHIECRVLATTDLDIMALEPQLRKRFYTINATEYGNTHTMYFAEILSCYKEERHV